jgi:hypothetical protein
VATDLLVQLGRGGGIEADTESARHYFFPPTDIP